MSLWNRAGLCPVCRHVRETGNRQGSVFFLCTRSQTDPRFPKYPPMPVLACPGFEPQSAGESKAEPGTAEEQG